MPDLWQGLDLNVLQLEDNTGPGLGLSPFLLFCVCQ